MGAMEGSTPDFHRDILVQIFYKLPIRSLLWCKLVCKEWHSLISSDPLFISNYNSIIEGRQVNVLVISEDSILNYEIDKLGNGVVIQSQPHSVTHSYNGCLVGACNGLVAFYEGNGDMHLFNPYKGEKRTVCGAFSWYAISYSPVLLGLCYNSSNNEYKVVMSLAGSYDNFLDPVEVCVVSFKRETVKFKSGQHLPYMANPDHKWPATVVNGLPHWIVSEDHLIYFFDQQKEEFEMIPKPQVWSQNSMLPRGLVVLNSQLGVMVQRPQELGFELWAVEDYGNDDSWTYLLAFTGEQNCFFPSSFLLKNNRQFLVEVELEHQFPTEEDLEQECSKVVIYDCDDHTHRELFPGVESASLVSSGKVVFYSPSLASPCSQSEQPMKSLSSP